MENTIKDVEQRIAECRETIAVCREKVKAVENDEDYNHEYWQGLTDELSWYEAGLQKDLRLLQVLQRDFRRLEELRKLSRGSQ